MSDWFRKKTWAKDDEEHFFTKLSRARKNGRAQYLKIQAIELLYTKDNKLLNIAKELLQKVLDDYPDNNLEKSSVYKTFGDIFLLEKNLEKAIEYYRKAIDFEKVYPNVKTNSDIIYSELIIKNKLTNEYLNVEKILEEKISGLLFPIDKYKVFSMLAILNYYNSNIQTAKEYALLANENAQAETSGLRYHKHLGIVSERDDFFDRIINKL
jgi:tetratricopeptide (TPR) repeat protein